MYLRKNFPMTINVIKYPIEIMGYQLKHYD